MIKYLLIIFHLANIQTMSELVHYSPTPTHLEAVLFKYFEYEITEDRSISLNQFVHRKRGDCEYYARLTAHVLRKRGYSCQIFLLGYYNRNVAHVICVYKKGRKKGHFNLDTAYPGEYNVSEIAKKYGYSWYRRYSTHGRIRVK